MVDVITIILVLAVGVIGYFAGFGKVLKALSGGLVGKILVIVACYFSFGIVLDFPFVQDLMAKLVTAIQNANSPILNFLLTIRLDLIIFAICLYIVLSILRWLAVKLVGSFMEIQSKPLIVINKVLGIILALFWFVMFALIVFQILAWTTGVDGAVYQALQGSFLGIDKLFQANPLNAIFESIRLGA